MAKTIMAKTMMMTVMAKTISALRYEPYEMKFSNGFERDCKFWQLRLPIVQYTHAVRETS